jgi:DNA-binding HxlR family transcriptional regulator
MSEDGNFDGEIWKILGRRWTLAILQNLSAAEALRYSELKKLLPGISGTVLSERLLELEAGGLLTKKICSSVPPKVEYGLSASARELALLMRQIGDWNARWNSQGSMYELLSHPAR